VDMGAGDIRHGVPYLSSEGKLTHQSSYNIPWDIAIV
jgi:hypothetical protein